jgi:uncharacterized membrane protein YbjE (DUF340 family)
MTKSNLQMVEEQAPLLSKSKSEYQSNNHKISRFSYILRIIAVLGMILSGIIIGFNSSTKAQKVKNSILVKLM